MSFSATLLLVFVIFRIYGFDFFLYLVHPLLETLDTLAEALQRAISDTALRQRLADNGRAFIAEHYSRKAMADAIIAVYERVMGAL